MNKNIKSLVFVALISITALSLAGCGSQPNQGQANQGMMNTSNMSQYMTSNTTGMMDVLSSPDNRQSMVKIMGSPTNDARDGRLDEK